MYHRYSLEFQIVVTTTIRLRIDVKRQLNSRRMGIERRETEVESSL